MVSQMMWVSIVLPFLAALGCLIDSKPLRSILVIGTGVAVSLASLLLVQGQAFSLTPETLFGIPVDGLIAFLDFALLFVILGISYQLKNKLIATLTVLQIVPLAFLELFLHGGEAAGPSLYGDQLSMIMCLVISIIGSLICIYGLSYMDEHEHHLHLEKSRQGRFFFFMVLFLGAMNGLVFANNLLWLYFFWEVTTLCSFMLIKHDGTEVAVTNATRALWMNMLGGVAFVLALVVLRAKGMPLYLQELIATPGVAAVALLPIGLMCFAGFTKSAQVPFQSWLCGAMVAPTPVSALLHSSTMVKAGVYLVIRLAPAFAGTVFSHYVALFGAFTFLTTALLAISQSNGKKILAYSTISNLGMIIACAGINTPAAMAAAILLIVFHAISKGLMFLCVGTIEQKIGSRDIEDMRGLIRIMPKTAMIVVVGIVTMFLPPFGALLSKWMAVEASAQLPLVVLMLAIGSAFTMVFWGRWLGLIMTSVMGEGQAAEEQSPLVRMPLLILASAAVVVSFVAPGLYSSMVLPVLERFYSTDLYIAAQGVFINNIGMFAVFPIFLVMVLGVVWAARASSKKRVSQRSYSVPYVAGLQDPTDPRRIGFKGPLGQWSDFTTSNYYMDQWIGEGRITGWINLVSTGILIILLTGVL
ncbi:oxidoreductase [Thermodesulfomicrobium sp. WS]|uniref:NADH-quinone oxidoreductase subunit 5 family protein n=1 Tax=Thermodesulfomicrobium sp. WS TaxID=3004129 RepID=UPI00248F7298|nr:proton-conducting transporter membrane subunit [Thermodesulfomicrobium sp. WS]BDV00258.1 oxidoreductase [Thermodesulfomicrobium sp. WS]